VHTTDASALYFPLGHVVHVVDPATETCVLLHGEHIEIEFAPIAVEKVSSGPKVHSAFPSGLAVYVPGIQATHWACSVRASKSSVDLPAAHGKQLSMLVSSVSTEYLPATQFVHAALPLSLLYFLARHCAQSPAMAPVHPALHEHTLVVDPDTAMFDPSSHGVHSSDPGIYL